MLYETHGDEKDPLISFSLFIIDTRHIARILLFFFSSNHSPFHLFIWFVVEVSSSIFLLSVTTRHLVEMIADRWPTPNGAILNLVSIVKISCYKRFPTCWPVLFVWEDTPLIPSGFQSSWNHNRIWNQSAKQTTFYWCSKMVRIHFFLNNIIYWPIFFH